MTDRAKRVLLTLPTFVLGLVLGLAIPGCGGLPPEAEALLEDGVAYNEGTMRDERNPEAVRSVAQRNYDLLHKLRFTIDGTPLPEEVAARKAARDAARAAVSSDTEAGGQ